MASTAQSSGLQNFRPPAAPLVTVDPYFCIWSMADKLTDEWPKHWTGAVNGMCGMARIDGKPYRFMGILPADVPVMEQKSVTVYPTRTVYEFEAGGVSLTVTFTTPLLLDDMDVMSRPASYIEYEAKSTDGKDHSVALYQDSSGETTVNTSDQKIVWSRYQLGDGEKLQLLRMGSADQHILGRSGDDLRIEWGYLYLVFPDAPGNSGVIANVDGVRKSFTSEGKLPANDDLDMPRSANNGWPVMACSMDMGAVGSKPVSRLVTLVYDDIYPVEYLHRKLRPYWRRNGMDIQGLIKAVVKEYPDLAKRCEKFDKAMLADAEKCGGPEYAAITSLAYRQAIAAHKLAVDVDGRGMFFSKENFSNGCMATVDVSYPSSPIFLLFNTDVLRAMLEPVLQYSASSMLWPNDFAPHDLGQYPLANGQVYGGGAHQINYQMPVEESGNMLIMLGAMSHIEGNADYAGRYWDVISRWAAYLKDKGLDPENQLCTDDFAGHLAHNTNLSIKAIMGLGCYAQMADMLGKKDVAAEYRKTAEAMAKKWKEMASDGDHYRLAFDQPGTWSMKYNLVWDKMLGLNLFDPSIAKTEIASYLKRQNAFGLPLDNRKEYTKGDWIVWTATLADSEKDFKAIVSPLYKYLDESPSRVPFSDWHMTTDGAVVGFRARSVVGGVFIKMLACPGMWEKWNPKAKK